MRKRITCRKLLAEQPGRLLPRASYVVLEVMTRSSSPSTHRHWVVVVIVVVVAGWRYNTGKARRICFLPAPKEAFKERRAPALSPCCMWWS